MVSQGQANLETVLFDYLGALRGGDHEAARELLAPDVVWQGLHEELALSAAQLEQDPSRWR